MDFPKRGANPKSWGRNNFLSKQYENERNWTEGTRHYDQKGVRY